MHTTALITGAIEKKEKKKKSISFAVIASKEETHLSDQGWKQRQRFQSKIDLRVWISRSSSVSRTSWLRYHCLSRVVAFGWEVRVLISSLCISSCHQSHQSRTPYTTRGMPLSKAFQYGHRLCLWPLTYAVAREAAAAFQAVSSLFVLKSLIG